MLSEQFSQQEKRMLQYLLPRDSLAFSRYFFKNKEARKYIVNPHHHIMADVKRKVFEGKIKRLIINIPPGYSKTEEWVVNFMAEGLAINPQALFMHLSYADDLALENSTKCRDIVTSPEYQELFNVPIRNDVSSKKKWYTKAGGGVYATASGGQVTGFRAGRMIEEVECDPKASKLIKEIDALELELDACEDPHEKKARNLRRKLLSKNKRLNRRVGNIDLLDLDEAVDEALAEVSKIDKARLEGLPNFWGALIIDDPIKPDDSFSEPIRTRINARFMNTFKSRLAVESETPLILIMQRVHEDDPSGFLLKGGTGEKWHHLMLPVEIPEGRVRDWYPQDYKFGIPIEYDLPPGPLWRFKHTQQQIDAMEKADPFTCSAQYHQKPSPKGGKIFKDEYWQYYTAIPEGITTIRIYCDTAQQTNERNDYSVFEAWGYVPGRGIFLLDLFREKLESPELENALKAFWQKHKKKPKTVKKGASIVKVENKSSGSGLIQTIKRKTNIPIVGIERNRDKVSRAMDVVPHIASGNVYIPTDKPWVFDFVDECRKFTPLMTHKNDDQIDPMMDAIEDMLINQVNIYEGMN